MFTFALWPRPAEAGTTFDSSSPEEIAEAKALVTLCRYGYVEHVDDIMFGLYFIDRSYTELSFGSERIDLTAVGTNSWELKAFYERNQTRKLASAMRRVWLGQVKDKVVSANWIAGELRHNELQPEDIGTSWQELKTLGAAIE